MSHSIRRPRALCVPSGGKRAVTTRWYDFGPHRLRGVIGAVTLLFIAAAMAGPAFSQPLPLLEYRFEEGSGTRVASTGTVTGGAGVLQNGSAIGSGPVFSRDTPQGTGSGYSLHLGGTNDLVRIPDVINYTVDGQPSTTPLSQLTVEAWIKPDSVGDGLLRAIWDDYGSPGVFLGLRDDQVQFTISTSQDPGAGITLYGGKIAAGVWQHVAAVYDGTQVRIYVDGQDTGVSAATSGSIQDNSYVNAGRASITIGAENKTLGLNFSGMIDEPRITPAALTADTLARGFFANRAQAQAITYELHDRGAVSLTTDGTSTDASAGYGRVEPGVGYSAPVGLAIFGLRQNGVLVTQAGVQASGLIRSGRIPVSITGSLDTGLAIANPFSQDVIINFYFTDENGATLRSGTAVISAFNQIARFLTQAPFSLGSPVQGTLTFTANGPVAAVALRGLLNERNEFLITTLPVTDITAPGKEPVVMPHFADGGGWATEILLINPSDTKCEGTVQFYDQGNATTPGRAVSMIIDGATGTSFNYSIPAKAAKRLRTSSPGSSLTEPGTTMKVGSVVVTPNADNYAPSVLVIFSHNSGDVTDTEAGVSSIPPSTAFRMYVEADSSFGAPGSIQSGFAVANPSSDPVTVNLELTTMSGESAGYSASLDLPGRGQKSMFLSQVDGFQGLPSPFHGQLRISTSAPSGLTVTGLAGHINERGDFLITTTAAADEIAAPSTAELFFPQIADGGGYTTQMILLSGSPGMDPPGRVRFFSSEGQPLQLSFPDLSTSVTR